MRGRPPYLSDASERGTEGGKCLSPCRADVGSEFSDGDELARASVVLLIGPS